MDQIHDYADDRLLVGCIYCGGKPETRDHVPSKSLLDQPLPENLPVVGACWSCNRSFSSDEEYFACLIECVISGSTELSAIKRSSIVKTLEHSPALRARIEAAKSIVNGRLQFNIEPDRIRNVVVKLARGHAAYELSQACCENPTTIWWKPLEQLSREELEEFESPETVESIAEIGSRGMQRFLVAQFTLSGPDGQQHVAGMLFNDWIDVQQGRYRYHASDFGDEIRIKLVVSEYLACQVTWTVT